MPILVFVGIAALAVALRFVVLPALGIKGDQSVGLNRQANDDAFDVRMMGSKNLYINVPAGALVVRLVMDGRDQDIGAAQSASGSPPNMRLSITRPSGAIAVTLAFPSGLGNKVLGVIGPENYETLKAQGLIHTPTTTIRYGA